MWNHNPNRNEREREFNRRRKLVADSYKLQNAREKIRDINLQLGALYAEVHDIQEAIQRQNQNGRCRAILNCLEEGLEERMEMIGNLRQSLVRYEAIEAELGRQNYP